MEPLLSFNLTKNSLLSFFAILERAHTGTNEYCLTNTEKFSNVRILENGDQICF